MAKRPKFRHTTMQKEVRRVDGTKRPKVPTYAFNGRIFKERDRRGSAPT